MRLERNELLDAIDKVISESDEYEAFYDLYCIAYANMQAGQDVKRTVQSLKLANERILDICGRMVDSTVLSQFYRLHKEILHLAARHDFDCYLLFTEWNRDLPKKFYQPRRKQLKCIVDMLQRLEDGELDMVMISQPPGTGKSTLGLFFLTWVSGRNPNLSNLIGSHSDTFDKQAYDECMAMIDPKGEYLWKDVFPEYTLGNANAKDRMFDIIDSNKNKARTNRKFKTLEFTSLGSGNAGVYRAQNYLYCDDLIKNMEVAMSKDRLDKVWQQYTDDLRQRKQGNCKELHIATQWSVHDVISRLKDKYLATGRVGVISLPALNENEESNFDYPFGLGFSTQMYKEQREIMDRASWLALFQQEPIEREGLVYDRDELKRFFELPDMDPDAILAVCDTKDKGKDYAVQPVAYVYGQNIYIADVICDNGLPDTVDTRLAESLMRHKVQMAQYEANNAGRREAQMVQQMVKNLGGNTKITSKASTSNKETRIIVQSAWVKEHCYFLDDSMIRPGSDYFRFVNMLTSYTLMGQNKHDDVPDAMAMLADYVQSFTGAQITIFKRPF